MTSRDTAHSNDDLVRAKLAADGDPLQLAGPTIAVTVHVEPGTAREAIARRFDDITEEQAAKLLEVLLNVK